MIEELTKGMYKITTDGDATYFTELELSEILRWDKKRKSEGETPITRYNTPSKKIKEEFEQRYDGSTTKKSIFEQIAKDYGVTWKAVEKAYYKKEKE